MISEAAAFQKSSEFVRRVLGSLGIQLSSLPVQFFSPESPSGSCCCLNLKLDSPETISSEIEAALTAVCMSTDNGFSSGKVAGSVGIASVEGRKEFLIDFLGRHDLDASGLLFSPCACHSARFLYLLLIWTSFRFQVFRVAISSAIAQICGEVQNTLDHEFRVDLGCSTERRVSGSCKELFDTWNLCLFTLRELGCASDELVCAYQRLTQSHPGTSRSEFLASTDTQRYAAAAKSIEEAMARIFAFSEFLRHEHTLAELVQRWSQRYLLSAQSKSLHATRATSLRASAQDLLSQFPSALLLSGNSRRFRSRLWEHSSMRFSTVACNPISRLSLSLGFVTAPLWMSSEGEEGLSSHDASRVLASLELLHSIASQRACRNRETYAGFLSKLLDSFRLPAYEYFDFST
eukprot:ANDGO_01988.mRNA.1 hypothetical protein